MGRPCTQHAVRMALESNLKESAANALLSLATAEALVGESAKRVTRSRDWCPELRFPAAKDYFDLMLLSRLYEFDGYWGRSTPSIRPCAN